jgi:hypothetical protein
MSKNSAVNNYRTTTEWLKTIQVKRPKTFNTPDTQLVSEWYKKELGKTSKH